jgi:N-acetylglucosaminyldiphosphoundecaprenol N-acetyl-beta-D-mannosaminyltransferase
MSRTFFSIPIENAQKLHILEKIKQFIHTRCGWMHIVSLNPENIVIGNRLKEFDLVLQKAEIKIFDGIGTYMTGRILGIPAIEHIPGIDLMKNLFTIAEKNRLKVLLIGGKGKIADMVVKCQSHKYPNIIFFSLEGIKDILNPKVTEEEHIFSIVRKEKPHFVFVAFGSPSQELWLYKNRAQFSGCVCMGVGQAFDVLSRTIPRAPYFIRKIGFEWLYRLIRQPWRWRRQLRLIKFIVSALREIVVRNR